MTGVTVEIKARCADPAAVRRRLVAAGAESRGVDRQVDTFFRVPSGRLKLRQGRIENALIFYDRPDRSGPKTCRARLVPTAPSEAPGLRALLAAALGVRCVVRKRREILFIGNVKFHIDRVVGLGAFVEIEARGREAGPGRRGLRAQCVRFRKLLGIAETDLVPGSYADMGKRRVRRR